MPGDVFSFNETLGKRTMEDGYRLAPVLANGRHDVGIGGGICQVSSTLYNAVALANLKIVLRHNHSMASAYVPVGRDCTVSYPQLDFKFQNNGTTPVAISRTYTPGKLTFRILGQKVPGQVVKIQTAGHRSWGRGQKMEHDPSLPYGKRRVVEKGSSGHAITVYRIVTVNGTEVSREVLNKSHYPGALRIVAVNMKAKPKAPEAVPPADGGSPTPPEAPNSDGGLTPPL
jgi:vancomycin resistance protein YoaR